MADSHTSPLLPDLNGVPLSDDERQRLLAVARRVDGVVAAAAAEQLQFDQTPWSFSTLLMQSSSHASAGSASGRRASQDAKSSQDYASGREQNQGTDGGES